MNHIFLFINACDFYIAITSTGRTYVKVACIYEKEDMVHQCWDCESQGELYDYGDEDFSDLEEGMSVH